MGVVPLKVVRYLAWVLSAVALVGIGGLAATLFLKAGDQEIPISGRAEANKWARMYPYIDGHYPVLDSSWAKTVERSNLRSVSLNAEERHLTRVFITKLGDKVSEVDFTGPTPLVFNNYDIILWDQCQEISIETFISSTLTPKQLTITRDAIGAASQKLRELTGLNISFPAYLLAGGVSFTEENLSTYQPKANTIEVHVAEHQNAALGNKEIALATTWHTVTDSDRASITSGLIALSTDFLDRYPDGGFDSPSLQLAAFHELSHAVGIGHSSDGASYMFPYMGTEASITAPDRVVLALTGSRPCYD
ncbi:MAG: hypothetical protein QF638_07055 [Acidimicrobiales bacterium]|nr:hypothetical protein [Acidimicrobiales bacterium]HCV36944.1 hypothetical protein [Acidimicrobiaceae bacterium]HJO79238.1 hypothetical protein [Acidimicrobiales bacterium]